MQLKFERDFFIRPARGSDMGEALALIQKHHSEAASAKISADFASLLNRPDLFFKILLNSNGVLIGAILAEKTQILTLSVNPNFLRKEVRDEITRQLREWANEQNAGKLLVPKEVVAGDWKAYLKHHSVKVESMGGGFETLEFV